MRVCQKNFKLQGLIITDLLSDRLMIKIMMRKSTKNAKKQIYRHFEDDLIKIFFWTAIKMNVEH